MCICIGVYVSVETMYVHASAPVYVPMCTYVRVCMCAIRMDTTTARCAHTHSSHAQAGNIDAHRDVHSHTHAHTHTRTYTQTHSHPHPDTFTHLQGFTHTHTLTRTHIHTYTHTYSQHASTPTHIPTGVAPPRRH